MKRVYKTYRPVETIESRALVASAYSTEIANLGSRNCDFEDYASSAMIFLFDTDKLFQMSAQICTVTHVTSVIAGSGKIVRTFDGQAPMNVPMKPESGTMVKSSKSYQNAMGANASRSTVGTVTSTTVGTSPAWITHTSLDPEAQSYLDLLLS